MNSFVRELVPVPVPTRNGESLVTTDEAPHKVQLEKISRLKPAFSKDGTVTAANSSSISDGAAALVITRLSTAQARGLKPLAFVRGHAHPLGGTKMVHDRSLRGDPEAAQVGRLADPRCRLVGDQRGIRGGHYWRPCANCPSRMDS